MPNHVIPDLTYDRAMALSVVIPVKDAPAGVFASLMQHAVQTARNPEKALSALRDLDYNNTVDRWFALNSLKELGIALPLGKS